MKITIVMGAFFPVPPIMGGAVEKVWFALGREFARQGHLVVQISRRDPRLAETETIDGVTHIRVKGFDQPRSILWLKLLDLIYSWRVLRVLPAADVLVTNTFWLPILIRSSKRGLLYVHVARQPKRQMRLYAHVARLQAVSQAIGETIVAQTPSLKSKVKVIPNALPFRIEVNMESRTKTILYVGRIHPEKGIELLLQALCMLNPELVTNWKCTVIGPHQIHLGGGGDDFLQSLQKRSRQTALPVEWMGPVFDESELLRQYRRALLFVYPSLAETGEAMPVAPLEAMANGCVPIVSDLACFRDYIEDNMTGFVFNHRGLEPDKELAARLLHILTLGEEEIIAMGRQAQARAGEFAVETVAQRYLQDFESLRLVRPNDQRDRKMEINA